MSTNHTKKPITQRRVTRRIERLGGAGNGLDNDSLLSLPATEPGIGGRGFNCAGDQGEAAVRVRRRLRVVLLLALESLGGTGGPSVWVWRLR